MISDIFKRDYKAMTASGVVFTPEDIIRLNALALKVSHARHAAHTVRLPRVAFLGDLAVRQPSVAHDIYIERVAEFMDLSDDRQYLLTMAFILSRSADELPDAYNPSKVVNAVARFAAKKLAAFTIEQITAAVTYAMYGNDWADGEAGPVRGEREPDVSPALGIMVEARACRLGITCDEARHMTASELVEAIIRAKVRDGTFDADYAFNEAMGEYVRAREEIRCRKTT